MEYPIASHLVFPITPYTVGGYAFGTRVRSRVILWARHLGDDIIVDPATPVVAIGDGKVVWSEMRKGRYDHRNWGGIAVVGHTHKDTGESFFSLYGHITDRGVRVGDVVKAGDRIGVVAQGRTPENGWWNIAHLHFGIYVGPFMDDVLPGYLRPFERRTKFHWWRDPGAFIQSYTLDTHGKTENTGV